MRRLNHTERHEPLHIPLWRRSTCPDVLCRDERKSFIMEKPALPAGRGAGAERRYNSCRYK